MKTQNILLPLAAFAAGALLAKSKSSSSIGAMMPTLKEISAMYPGDYSVYDSNAQRGYIKSWDDNIQIYLRKLGKTKQVKRRSAYNVGLAEKADD
jgi:hypothetical protein